MIFIGRDIESTGGVDFNIICDAEIELGMKFSSDFIEYLNKYGTVEFNNRELFGLGITGYRNIVDATQHEKTLSSNFPSGYCVIYNLGINSILILLGNDGYIYEYTPRSVEIIFKSFNQWIAEEFLKY